jgi:hypothetical protein
VTFIFSFLFFPFSSDIPRALNCPGDDSLWQLLNQLRGRELKKTRNGGDDEEFNPVDELLRPLERDGF